MDEPAAVPAGVDVADSARGPTDEAGFEEFDESPLPLDSVDEQPTIALARQTDAIVVALAPQVLLLVAMTDTRADTMTRQCLAPEHCGNACRMRSVLIRARQERLDPPVPLGSATGWGERPCPSRTSP